MSDGPLEWGNLDRGTACARRASVGNTFAVGCPSNLANLAAGGAQQLPRVGTVRVHNPNLGTVVPPVGRATEECNALPVGRNCAAQGRVNQLSWCASMDRNTPQTRFAVGLRCATE